MDAERIAAHWADLMQGLGYSRFGAQGGDWGSMVSTYLGLRHKDVTAGIHLNFVVAFPLDQSNPSLALEPGPRHRQHQRVALERVYGRAEMIA